MKYGIFKTGDGKIIKLNENHKKVVFPNSGLKKRIFEN